MLDMNRYTPLFSQIVDSSIWEEDDSVCKVFMTLLAKQDGDHVVRGSAYNIAQWSKKTESEVLKALKVLASPDKKRLERQPFDGRRIEKVDDGWLLLNGQKYQQMMFEVNRRAYQRQKQAEYRARKRSKDLVGQATYDRIGVMPHEEGLA